MANAQGGFQKLEKCGAGSQPIIMTGDQYDRIIDLLNAVGGMSIKPESNVGQAFVNQGMIVLDFTSLDGRITALEAATGVSSNTTINTSLQVQITALQAADANFNARLANATATSNCVGNSVITTFTI